MNRSTTLILRLQINFVECSLYLPHIMAIYSNSIIRLLLFPPFVPKVSKRGVFIYIYNMGYAIHCHLGLKRSVNALM